MPLILPGNVGSATAATGYDVANSCRFNDDDSAYMHKTCGSAFNTDRWTISLWFKRGNLGIDTRLISCDNDDGSNDDYIRFDSSDQMEFMIYEGSSIVGLLKPNMVFRDVSAWYHLVCVWDSANGTAGNRMRMYVNGTEVTSFETDTNPSEGVNASWGNTSHPIEVGRRGSANNQYFDGYMAEVAVCDGQAYAASDFGEFDEDSGIWKPIDVSGLTFGTSGFYLDFQASGNLGNDANGGTDLTEVNLAATDQSTDTCTNNSCVINSLDAYWEASTFSEGNCKIVTESSDYSYNTSTIGLTTGKWYCEVFIETTPHPTTKDSMIGIAGRMSEASQGYLGLYADTYGIYGGNGNIYNDGSASYGVSHTTNDIIGIYMDLDNNKLYFAINGTIQNSGTGVSITAVASTTNGFYFPMVGDVDSDAPVWEVNFGNPISPLTSAVSDVNGYGSFEYDPSAGTFDSASKDFLAICTKNLATDG